MMLQLSFHGGLLDVGMSVTKTNVAGVLLLPLALFCASAAPALDDSCLTGTAPVVVDDAGQIRAVRALIDAACICSSFDGTADRTRRDYLRCAAAVIESQVDAGALRPRCKRTVRQYYARSTCGRLPNLHAQTCVQRSVRTGRVKCTVRPTTRRDGTTPTDSCVDRPGQATRVACPAHTHCIDAADTDGNLIIAAPGDTGLCATLPMPTHTASLPATETSTPTAPDTATMTPTPADTVTTTPTEASTATTTPTPSAAGTIAPTATATACMEWPSIALDLQTNRAKWAAARIATYDLDYQRTCSCPAPGDVEILVTDGAITSVLDSSTGQEIVDPPAGANGFNSVDGLFDVIAAAIDGCVVGLSVDYDPELGYPTSVFIDFGGGTGDEVLIRINDLRRAGVATFPFALGECHFDPQCMDQSCMPSLSYIPSPETDTYWSSFFQAAANSNINDYFPAACGGGLTQRLGVGDTINLGNGQVAPLLLAVECTIADGQTIFTVPLVSCELGEFPAAAAVTGFAKIQIDSVVTVGLPKGVFLHGIWEE